MSEKRTQPKFQLATFLVLEYPVPFLELFCSVGQALLIVVPGFGSDPSNLDLAILRGGRLSCQSSPFEASSTLGSSPRS